MIIHNDEESLTRLNLLEEARGAAKFSNLTSSEIRLLNTVTQGEITYCGPSHSDTDKKNDPSSAGQWSKDRTVRSSLIAWLCDAHSKEIPLKGVQLHSALIQGPLDLSFKDLSFRIIFRLCSFTDDIDMRMSSLRELSLSYSSLQGINLSRTAIKGSLLSSSCTYRRQVLLKNLHIGENLVCDDSRFIGRSGGKYPYSDIALDCSNAVIGGNLSLLNVKAHSAVYLVNTKIGGDLDASGGSFKSAFAANKRGDSDAFNADSVQVAGDITLGGQLSAIGTINLDQATCGGSIELRDGTTLVALPNSDNAEDFCFTVADARIGRSLTFDDKFIASGSINLSATHIGGNLEAIGSHVTQSTPYITKPAAAAIEAGNTIIGGDVRFDRVSVVGRVNFERADVGGDFSCDDGQLSTCYKQGAYYSLTLGLMTVKGGLSLADLHSKGSLLLNNARVSGDVSLSRAVVLASENLAGNVLLSAVNLESMSIGGSLVMNRLSSEGSVSVVFAIIGGNLQCTDASFKNSYSSGVNNTGIAFSASRAVVKANVMLNGTFTAVGLINMSDAVVGGAFDCTTAQMNLSLADLNPGSGIALTCYRLQLAGDLFLNGVFETSTNKVSAWFASVGGIVLDQAQVGGKISINGAHLKNPRIEGVPVTGRALSAFSTKVNRGLSVRRSLVEGEIYVANSSIGEAYDCTGLRVISPYDAQAPIGKRQIAFSLVSSTAAAVYLVGGFAVTGYTDLHGTDVSVLSDDPETWPTNGELNVEGFSYKSIARESGAPARLRWLRLQATSPVPTQSYLQLAKILSDHGDEEGSKQVLISLEDLRSTGGVHHNVYGISRRLLIGRTIGYGYRPLNAVWGLTVLTGLGWMEMFGLSNKG